VIAMSVCAGWILLWVVAYWCLTLLDWQFLRPVMTDVRRAAVSLGVVGLLAAIVWAEPGETGWLRSIPLICGLLATWYCWRNQWLFPKLATELQPCSLQVEDEELVAVLAGGQGVSIALLSRARTAVFDNQLLVHCGLARSLAVFKRRQGQRPRAVLPHATGFFIAANDDNALIDGVDGSSADPESNLVLQPLRLCSYRAWRESQPQATLLAPMGLKALPTSQQRKPRLKGAVGVEDPLAWGRVEDGVWHVVSAPDQKLSALSEEPRRYLSRWAALARGLKTVASEPEQGTATADSG
jgi:hypothetical protein